MSEPANDRLHCMRLLLGLALSIGACAAHDHTDEYFDKHPGPHGGQIRMAGPFHMELVVDARQLSLHVTDHGSEPVATERGSAKAIITSGKNRFVVLLKPVGDNVLEGAGDYRLGTYNEILVMLALPDQEVQRATFVYPKGAKPAAQKAKKKKKRQRSAPQQT
jgi:hypothetical protein